MTLTFLNLVVVNGILVGLIEGAGIAYRGQYSGDVLIGTKLEKPFIQDSVGTINFIRSLPGVEAVSGRYLIGGKVEANYKTKIRPSDATNSVGTSIVGLNLTDEEAVTGISEHLVAGEFLDSDDYGEVVLGGYLLEKYFPVSSPSFPTLKNVDVGDKVRVVIGDKVREVKIKGILLTKVDEVSRRVFFNDKELRNIIGRSDYNVHEISVKLAPDVSPEKIKDQIVSNGYARDGNVQTWEESQGKFFDDIKKTFSMLGNAIGSIGLAVASITIFIVIFINAITRRKFIGILKGIGISGKAIEISYIIQSVFYALIGSVVGLISLYFGLIPFIDAHPINFPFSDGILLAPLPNTLIRVTILIITTIIAGYIPARIVIKKNTLDSILGR